MPEEPKSEEKEEYLKLYIADQHVLSLEKRPRWWNEQSAFVLCFDLDDPASLERLKLVSMI